ncbi:MAG: hypothetical protein ACTSXP_16510 [Promethearchaeota archaeon]
MGLERRYYNQYLAMLEGMAEWGSPVPRVGINPNDANTWTSHIQILESQLPGRWQKYINNPDLAARDTPSFNNALVLALAAELYRAEALGTVGAQKAVPPIVSPTATPQPAYSFGSNVAYGTTRPRTTTRTQLKSSPMKKQNIFPILGIIISIIGFLVLGAFLGPVGIIFGIIGLKLKQSKPLSILSILLGIGAIISYIVYLDWIGYF